MERLRVLLCKTEPSSLPMLSFLVLAVAQPLNSFPTLVSRWINLEVLSVIHSCRPVSLISLLLEISLHSHTGPPVLVPGLSIGLWPWSRVLTSPSTCSTSSSHTAVFLSSGRASTTRVSSSSAATQLATRKSSLKAT